MGAVESAIHSLIRRAASAYTPGPRLEDARDVCRKLAREGIANVVCYWDVYADHPGVISQSYVDVLRAVSNSSSDCYLSIKAPALKFDLTLVQRILEEARRL